MKHIGEIGIWTATIWGSTMLVDHNHFWFAVVTMIAGFALVVSLIGQRA